MMRRVCLLILLALSSACLPEAVPTRQPTNTRPPLPTQRPTNAESPTPIALPTETPIPDTNDETSANVVPGDVGVNLRESPGTAGEVIRTIRGIADVSLIGRTDDSAWVEAEFVDGIVGWLEAEFVETGVDIASLPITGQADNSEVILLLPTALPDASVNAGGLRLRSFPGLAGEVLANLDEREPLNVIGRTTDNDWLHVQTEAAITGWVATSFVDLNIPLQGVPATRQTIFLTPTPEPAIQTASGFVGAVSNINPGLRDIYERGLEQGNRADVFSKIGDSITASPHFLRPIGLGSYNLGEYGYLQEVITTFSAVNARDGNSFANFSLSATDGWTSAMALNPENANTDVCQPGEAPIECEYRIVKPAFALIMYGTNDVSLMDAATFRGHMERIVELTIERGIIPIISTIPPRADVDVTNYNNVLGEISRTYSVPLWNYYAIMETALNRGLDDDGIHPSVVSQDDITASANFAEDGLQFGYNLRNLTALMTLDAVWRSLAQN